MSIMPMLRTSTIIENQHREVYTSVIKLLTQNETVNKCLKKGTGWDKKDIYVTE